MYWGIYTKKSWKISGTTKPYIYSEKSPLPDNCHVLAGVPLPGAKQNIRITRRPRLSAV